MVNFMSQNVMEWGYNGIMIGIYPISQLFVNMISTNRNNNHCMFEETVICVFSEHSSPPLQEILDAIAIWGPTSSEKHMWGVCTAYISYVRYLPLTVFTFTHTHKETRPGSPRSFHRLTWSKPASWDHSFDTNHHQLYTARVFKYIIVVLNIYVFRYINIYTYPVLNILHTVFLHIVLLLNPSAYPPSAAESERPKPSPTSERQSGQKATFKASILGGFPR